MKSCNLRHALNFPSTCSKRFANKYSIYLIFIAVKNDIKSNSLKPNAHVILCKKTVCTAEVYCHFIYILV